MPGIEGVWSVEICNRLGPSTPSRGSLISSRRVLLLLPQHAGFNWTFTIRPLQIATQLTTVVGYLDWFNTGAVSVGLHSCLCRCTVNVVALPPPVPCVLLSLSPVRDCPGWFVLLGTCLLYSQRVARSLAAASSARYGELVCNDTFYPAILSASQRLQLR